VREDPSDWGAEELRRLIESARAEVRGILSRYSIAGDRAKEILSQAMVSVALTKATQEEARQLLLTAIESACREERAALGPTEEQEEEPRVH
jgi:hypothetical protein